MRLGPEGLVLGGTPVPIHSAGFPYWMLPPERWGLALDAFLELRLRLVRLDVPWAVHERAPRAYDWGQRRPELDLTALLDAIGARGLLAWIRPGPWLGAGHERGGLPARVAPLSPLSREFCAEAEDWLLAVAGRIGSRVHPHGPLVGWIAGEEGPPHARGGGRLERDADGSAFFTRYTVVKYPPGLAPVGNPPLGGPSAADQIERCVAWVEAGEAACRVSVEATAGSQPTGPHGEPIPLIARIDDHPIGAGADPRAAGVADASMLALSRIGAGDFATLRLAGMRASDLEPLGGVTAIPASERLLERRGLDPVTAAAVLAMSGARALDLESLLARPGEIDGVAPLGRDGSLRERPAERWRALFRMLDSIDHTAIQRRTDCVLLANRELARLREACTEVAPVVADLAPPRVLEALRVRPRALGGRLESRDRPELDSDSCFHALFDGLRRAAIATGVAETSLSSERLAREQIALVPCFGRISRPLAQRLFEWVDAGGVLVVGPRLPTHDWSGASLGLELPIRTKERRSVLRYGALDLEEVDLIEGPEPVLRVDEGLLAAAAPWGAGRLVAWGFRFPWQAVERDPATLAEVVRNLVAPAGIDPCYATSDPLVETELYEGEARRFLFLVNPTPEDRAVQVSLAPGEWLREVRGRAERLGEGEALTVAARSVLLREVVGP